MSEENLTIYEASIHLGVARSTVYRALERLGYEVARGDPEDPASFRRVTPGMLKDLEGAVDRVKRADEVDLVELSIRLSVSETTIRRYLKSGLIDDFGEVEHPRKMYVFKPAQIERIKKRVECYEKWRREGFRFVALIEKVNEELPLEKKDEVEKTD